MTPPPAALGRLEAKIVLCVLLERMSDTEAANIVRWLLTDGVAFRDTDPVHTLNALRRGMVIAQPRSSP